MPGSMSGSAVATDDGKQKQRIIVLFFAASCDFDLIEIQHDQLVSIWKFLAPSIIGLSLEISRSTDRNEFHDCRSIGADSHCNPGKMQLNVFDGTLGLPSLDIKCLQMMVSQSRPVEDTSNIEDNNL